MHQTSNNTITLEKSAVLKQGGLVVLPLKKWQEIENELENLEMHNSQELAKEIVKRRQEETVPLEAVLKEHDI